MTSEERLEEIKLRLKKITPGKWKAFDAGPWGGQGAGVVIGLDTDMWPLFDKRTDKGIDNSFFVADAPDDIRWLIEQLEVERERSRKLIETLNSTLNYLNHHVDDLCGDDCIGDKKLTSRYLFNLKKITDAIAEYREASRDE